MSVPDTEKNKLLRLQAMRKNCFPIILVLMAAVPVGSRADQGSDWLDPPGQIYQVNKHRIHLYCIGSGSPTVLLEAGLGGFSLEWRVVQEQVAAQTRVCAYDRAGYGWSGPAPPPRSVDQLADELFELLTVAEIPAPYLLVGHSFGGYNVLYFAKVHPRLIAGIVLVESSHPEQAERLAEASETGVVSNSANTGRLITTFDPTHMLKHYPEALRDQALILMSTRRAIDTEQREFLNFKYSGFLVQQSGRLPDVPLVVVTRGRQEWPDTPRGHTLEEIWQTMQRELVALVPDASQVIAEKSGHLIQLEQPDIVVASIRSVLDRVQKDHPSGVPEKSRPEAVTGSVD